MPFRLLSFVLFFACLGALSHAAFAYTVLSYQPIDDVMLRSFLKDTAVGADYAQVDLNGDGLDEVIVRRCPDDGALCSHDIYAQDQNDFIDLGQIWAYHIEVSREKQGGIYSLKAFDTPNNDYKYKLYVWDFAVSRYNGEL